jgi:hypothetical protein
VVQIYSHFSGDWIDATAERVGSLLDFVAWRGPDGPWCLAGVDRTLYDLLVSGF